jgi:hypothetical protein
MKYNAQSYRKRAAAKRPVRPLAITLGVLVALLLLLLALQQGWFGDVTLTSLLTGQPASAQSGPPDATGGGSTPAPVTPTPTPTPTQPPHPSPRQPRRPRRTAGHGSGSAGTGLAGVPLFTGKSKSGSATTISSFSDGGKLTWAVFKGTTPVPDYRSEELIAFGEPQTYANGVEGVLTFRGDHSRTTPSFGTRQVTEKKLEVVWTSETGAISALNSFWPGTGWTGQPLLVHWPEATRNAMNLLPEAKAKDLVEVIYPTLDGNIYFLDLETGKYTRDKINFGFSFKGTAPWIRAGIRCCMWARDSTPMETGLPRSNTAFSACSTKSRSGDFPARTRRHSAPGAHSTHPGLSTGKPTP